MLDVPQQAYLGRTKYAQSDDVLSYVAGCAARETSVLRPVTPRPVHVHMAAEDVGDSGRAISVMWRVVLGLSWLCVQDACTLRYGRQIYKIQSKDTDTKNGT